jgi:hypothetical protein
MPGPQSLVLFLVLGVAATGQTEPEPDPVITEISKQAGAFWRGAPDYTALETWHEKTISSQRHLRLHIGTQSLTPAPAKYQTRTIASLYGFSAFRKTPEALSEFRQVVTVDGKPPPHMRPATRESFRAALASRSDGPKHKMRAALARQAMGGVIFDFGQVLLLFTKARAGNYSFQRLPDETAGAESILVLSFKQGGGTQSLRIKQGETEEEKPLEGRIWVRGKDLVPIRVSLTASRKDGFNFVRDEAETSYGKNEAGMLLPASVVHRKFVDDELYEEDTFEYTEWQFAGPKASQ